jgi:hypothetical protein
MNKIIKAFIIFLLLQLCHSTNAQITDTICVEAGWNMLSLPLNVQDAHYLTIFPDAISKPFPYPYGYYSDDTLRIGKAYWIKFGAANSYIISGESIHTLEIVVNAGWNMIGSISYPARVKNIQYNDSEIIHSDYFRYNPASGYEKSDTITPGVGYWVKIDRSCKLIILSDGFYPTTLYKLNQAELDSLQEKLENKLLGTNYAAELDSFGLLGHGSVLRGKSSITDTAQVIALSKTALLYLGDFSNIVDTSTLYVERLRHAVMPPYITDWDISFKYQYYKGMEVWDSRTSAIVADDFIQIAGHHYKNLFIPQHNIISEEQAKMSLVGTEIHYYCWGPSTFVITDSSINLETMEQCVYPLVNSNSIELRVAWKVPISMYDSPMWYYFVDVVTGETIGVLQLFIC